MTAKPVNTCWSHDETHVQEEGKEHASVYVAMNLSIHYENGFQRLTLA
jgi:hypothetical protein